MFRGLSSWLGLQQPVAGGGQPIGDAPPEQPSETVAESAEEELQQAGDQELLHQAKDFGNYLFNFASAATKKITESVAETAQTIKKSVEEGKIDGIIDKTIIGDFQKEQKKFVEEQHTKKSEAAVPPWVDTNDEETIQQQILALSADKRNFLRDPPAGVQFNFDFDQMYPVALVMLQEDELLSKMRFALVPKLNEKGDKQSKGKLGEDMCELGQREGKSFSSPLFLLEDSADWEKELQQELQEYEVVTESEKRDENWDKEIEKMLQEEN
uniref:Synapse associated protein 1 n=1 Tax=Pan troglodytes TaxID=9598 RepID=H2QYC6_PANTR